MEKTCTSLAMPNKKAMERANIVIAIFVGLFCVMMTSLPTYASDGSSIISGITTGTQSIWNIIIGIAGPVAAIALAIQVIKIVWGGQKAAEEAKSTAIKIIIAIAVVLMAPMIVKTIQGWFNKADWSFQTY